MSETTKLKAIHYIVHHRVYDDAVKVDLITGLVDTSPYADTTRVDPPDCGCTDCITGWSRPAHSIAEYELHEYLRNEAKR